MGYYLSFFFLLFLIIIKSADLLDKPCARRKELSGYVCVCNATYCDTVERPTPLDAQHFILYSTSNSTPGFTSATGTFQNDKPQSNNVTIITVDAATKYQTLQGIGGSFTDSFGYNVQKLSYATQQNLLKTYFSPSGSEYSLARVPIAGTDFSTHVYTYDDVPYDDTLSHFNLTSDDFLYKISIIKEAQKLNKRNITLFASSWSCPSWMKDNNNYTPGYLLPKYHQLYSDYLIKFLNTYKTEGLQFWAITTGNELVVPIYLREQVYSFPNKLGLPHLHRIWYKHYLGPALRNSQHRNVKLITLDDQRIFANWWMDRIMADKDVAKYIDGIALHCYLDYMDSPESLDLLHKKYPDVFIMYSECTIIPFLYVGGPPIDPGSWDRGEYYASCIIESLNHWSVGFVDWNMAVNSHGPRTKPEYGDCTVMVDLEKDEFYKNPMFYALAHFSKFIRNGSVRIQSTMMSENSNTVQHTATKNPDGTTSVFLQNRSKENITVFVNIEGRGHALLALEAKSLNTLVFW